MSQSPQLKSNVSISVRDIQSKKSGASRNDKWTLSVDKQGNHHVTRSYDADVQGFAFLGRIDHLSLQDIPDRIAAEMQQYVDSSQVPWPSSVPINQADSQNVRVEITVSDGNDKYIINVYGGKHVRVQKGKQPQRKQNIPNNVINEANPYIPQNAQWL